jgi:glycosyltransferase involved in cell wall biosynthesis
MESDEGIKYEVVDADVPIPAQTVEKQDLNQMDIAIAEYVAKNKPNVCILTPCYGSVCFVDYVSCLMSTVECLKHYKIDSQIIFCKSDSLVSRARNNLVAKALARKDVTHIIFIDNDISWDPMSIVKLLMANKPVIGGVYPLKHYFWNKLLKDDANPYNSNVIQSWVNHKNASQLKDMIGDEALIQHKLLKYNINYLTAGTLVIDNNLAKVKHAATGFLMIQRDVFNKMFQAFPSTKYTDDVSFLEPNENEFAYALFDCCVEDGHYLSEDWVFCSRWAKMGGDIWIDVSINLTHTGIETFHGNYVSTII